MTQRSSTTSLSACILATAIALPPVLATAQEKLVATANFADADGVPNGTGTVTAVPVGVLIEFDIRGLPPARFVATHVHETGQCDPAHGHESAGGHFNPAGAPHGYLVEGGPHAGDLPNQYVDGDGSLHAQIFSGTLTLDGGTADIRGKTIIIHAQPDDYETQPAGGAGERIACAVLE